MLDNKAKSVKNGIPKELWIRARSEALLHGVTIAEWVAEAIKGKLEREAERMAMREQVK